MLYKKVKKETFDGSILTFEAWVHFLQQRQHTNMTKMEKNYASRHRNPDFDFEWACVSICICKGEEIREAIKTFDFDQ